MKTSRVQSILLLLIFSGIGFILYLLYFEPKSETNNELYYYGIEIGSSSAKYSEVELKETDNNDYHYRTIDDDTHQWGHNYADDEILSKNDYKNITSQLSNCLDNVEKCESFKKGLLSWNEVFIALGSSYARVKNSKDEISNFLKSNYPNFPIDNFEAIDERVEGKSDFLTVILSEECPFKYEEVLILDFGSGDTRFTVLNEGKTYGLSENVYFSDRGEGISYKNILDSIGVKNLDISSEKEKGLAKKRLDKLIRNKIQDVISSNSPFRRPDQVVILTGGLPFKIMRQLGQLETNRHFYDFKVQEIVDDLNEVIESNSEKFPLLERQELFAYNCFLELFHQEMTGGNAKSFYFFERKTWAPGYLIHKIKTDD